MIGDLEFHLAYSVMVNVMLTEVYVILVFLFYHVVILTFLHKFRSVCLNGVHLFLHPENLDFLSFDLFGGLVQSCVSQKFAMRACRVSLSFLEIVQNYLVGQNFFLIGLSHPLNINARLIVVVVKATVEICVHLRSLYIMNFTRCVQMEFLKHRRWLVDDVYHSLGPLKH